MKNKTWLSLLVAVAITALALGAFTPMQVVQAASLEGRGGPNGSGTSMGTGMGTGTAGRYGQGSLNNQAATCSGTGDCTATLTPLSEAEAQALQEAILEEYGAYNLYQAVIDQFGSQLPFSRILRSEQQHFNALIKQAEKYGVEVPANPGLANPPVFSDLTAACQAGVDAEIADAALYDELMLVTTHSDLLRVYQRLQSASLNQHLPAFEACN